ncbi:preprotein translocase subunit SecY [Vagococcus elongatus]|uniref:Protein translocase subunit SecY n=1 Tax=Vagococcus elongatus TaxID=180344 RepID=A0A430AV57_9ENTE|nr:preprotein translocase subunit SecY [Vagococcus elongatus]RSU11936.1 preprotein translocase subunit SecY [Vagococcus elongatus]
MFRLLKDAFKVKDIRNRIFFTLFILFAFRLGAHISVPGVNVKALAALSENPLFSMINTVSGSAMQNFSLFAMGVSPYITSSIVIQLLQMDIVPKFVEWSKQGEVGRRKLNQATRYLTLGLGFMQSIALTTGFNQYAGQSFLYDTGIKTYITIGIILTSGTMLLTWLGEQISEKGIGNGVSMIIFAGIISRLPSGIVSLVEDRFINIRSEDLWKSAIFTLVLLIAVFAIITFVTYFNQAERKIPIQYTKRVAGAPQSSYLPLKVNAAGVIPVIFASSIITTPGQILQFVAKNHSASGWYQILKEIFDYSTPLGGTLYAVLIIAFTFFYAFVQVNPEKVAENLQKQGSYIPSVRPGKGTEDYISSVLLHLSVAGSLFLTAVAILPIIAQNLFDLPIAIGLGGTSLLIAIGVALETAKQLEGLLMKRKYTGFIAE